MSNQFLTNIMRRKLFLYLTLLLAPMYSDAQEPLFTSDFSDLPKARIIRGGGTISEAAISNAFGMPMPVFQVGPNFKVEVAEHESEDWLKITYQKGYYGRTQAVLHWEFALPDAGARGHYSLYSKMKFATPGFFNYADKGKHGLTFKGGGNSVGKKNNNIAADGLSMWWATGQPKKHTGDTEFGRFYYLPDPQSAPQKGGKYGHKFPFKQNGKTLKWVDGEWIEYLQEFKVNAPGQDNGFIKTWVKSATTTGGQWMLVDNFQNLTIVPEGVGWKVERLQLNYFLGGGSGQDKAERDLVHYVGNYRGWYGSIGDPNEFFEGGMPVDTGGVVIDEPEPTPPATVLVDSAQYAMLLEAAGQVGVLTKLVQELELRLEAVTKASMQNREAAEKANAILERIRILVEEP